MLRQFFQDIFRDTEWRFIKIIMINFFTLAFELHGELVEWMGDWPFTSLDMWIQQALRILRKNVLALHHSDFINLVKLICITRSENQ